RLMLLRELPRHKLLQDALTEADVRVDDNPALVALDFQENIFAKLGLLDLGLFLSALLFLGKGAKSEARCQCARGDREDGFHGIHPNKIGMGTQTSVTP